MNLSMRWLNDYVKLEIEPRAFAEAMTMSGSKVESWYVEGADIERVVVGKVLSIVPHDHADNLVICQLDVGAREHLQIVTGAKNLATGDLVPVALDGATLPGHRIETT
ncbi:MAG: phenylalanine--tRNA ligase subunit beta, partial [Oscillospiraceae bacterium]